MTAFVIGIEPCAVADVETGLGDGNLAGLVKTQRRCLLRTAARCTDDHVTARRALKQQLIARYCCRFPSFDDKVISL